MSPTRITVLLLLCFSVLSVAHAEAVGLVYSRAPTPQSNYAMHELTAALAHSGSTVSGGSSRVIRLCVNLRLASEEFSIAPKGRVITVCGGDNRGLISAALALAQTLRNGVRLEQ